MLNIQSLRRTLSRNLTFTQPSYRNFHPTIVNMVKVGDPIPSVELQETTPGTKINLSKELKGKGLIIGVPAAFSTCALSSKISQ